MDHLKIIIKFTVPKVTGVKYDSFIKYENMCHKTRPRNNHKPHILSCDLFISFNYMYLKIIVLLADLFPDAMAFFSHLLYHLS